MAGPSNEKISGIIGTSLQLGIGTLVSLMKWSASLITFRNKADTAFVDVGVKTIQLNDNGGTNRKTTLGMPAGAAGDLIVNLPITAGTAGNVMQTDGAGNTSWVAAGTTSQCVTDDNTLLAFGTASPVAMFTLPINALIKQITVYVDTAFNGTSPVMSIGIAGTTSKYTGTGDVDLTTVGGYRIPIGLIPDGTTNALIITYTSGTSSAGAARMEVDYAVPQ